MKILSQDMIDRARKLIATSAANLVAANRIVVNSYGSHFVRRNLAGALSETRDALLNIATTKLPASARSWKLRRMEGMERADESRSARRLAKLAAAEEVRVDWYERYKANAAARRKPVMPFTMWLARDREERRHSPRGHKEAGAMVPAMTAWRGAAFMIYSTTTKAKEERKNEAHLAKSSRLR